MKNYLVLVRGGNPGFDELDEAAQQAHYGKWMAYIQKLTESGQWVKGNPLDESGRLYCEERDAKEGIVGEPDVAVGGYLILEADNYDAAVEACDARPALDIGGKVEIRECIEM